MFQHVYTILKRRRSRIGVSFSVLKTKLYHWRASKDGDTTLRSPVSLDMSLFHPFSSVQWFGYWLTPSIETFTHFQKRLAVVPGAFSFFKQLSTPGTGLASYINRRLMSGLICLILTYAADLFASNASTLGKMAVLWNKVLRWVTNCFYSMPVSILSCKACLPPLDSLLPHKRKMAASRIAC